MKILKTVLLTSMIALSCGAYADTISYQGYTLDESTNIVTGGGLEWLQWDETVGMSINQALATYGDDGWELASNMQMSTLLNDFDFGMTFDTDAQTGQEGGTGVITTGGDGADLEFVSLFGQTYWQGHPTIDYWVLHAQALFGDEPDGDGNYNKAAVMACTWWDGSPASDICAVEMSAADYTADDVLYEYYGDTYGGVALTRPAAVPLPAAGWLFMSALLGLMGKARLSRRT